MLFYMATRYKDEIPTWYSTGTEIQTVFQSNGEFQPEYYQMIYAWHTADPVSQKELDRNDDVYDIQGNANPYINHPEWVCVVFGGCSVNPEPTNYPTNFLASAVNSSQINLSWTDAVGTDLPDGYLIVGSTTNSFSDPVDGTDPATDADLSDGYAIIKVTQGTESYSFTGLSASTTYYFKIWSYSNTGTNIDFKTDGTAPESNATTLAASGTPELLISEISGKGYGGDYNDEYIEISNIGTASADLTNYTVENYEGTNLEATFDITGTLAANDAYVIAIRTTYNSITPDFVPSTSYSINNDFYVLLKENGTIKDQAGSTSDLFNDAYNYEFTDCSNDNLPVSNWDNLGTGNGTPGVVNCNTTPVLNVSTSSLSGFSYIIGNGPSAEQSFLLSGTNLDGTDVTLTPPADYEISKTSGSGFVQNPSYLTFSAYDGSDKTIYVRLKSGLAVGTYNNETISISGGGDSDGETVTLNGDVTTSSASDIILETTFTEPSNIPYINYQSANIINDGNDIEVAQFTIRDGGGTADLDNLSTILTDITFSVTNSADIQRIALYDGTTELAEVASAASVTFSGLTLTALDGASKTFSIRVSFNATVTDNNQFQFTVTSATADNTGSVFTAADAGGAQSTITGDENRIEVIASALSFTQQPSNTGINVAMSPNPAVEAIDANLNRDLDYAAAISVSSTGTMTGDPVAGTWASGVATFANLVHTVLGTGLTLTASNGSLSVVSNTFDITDACATDLIISEYVEGSSNNKYIEIYNGTGTVVNLDNYRIGIVSNGGTWTETAINFTAGATLADGATWVLANSGAGATVIAAADQTSGSLGYNGNDAVALQTSTGTNIDIVGTDGADPGTGWDVAGVTDATADHTLIRKSTIFGGETNWAISAGTSTSDSQWEVYAQDYFDNIGSHSMVCTCAEPTVHASALTFSAVTATSMTLTWTSGDGTNRIVLAKEASVVDGVPVDLTTYTANPVFGSGSQIGTGNFVIYNGSGNSVTVTNLTPGTMYYFKIFEYGCAPGSEDYLTSGTPEEGFETTLPNDVTNFQVDCTTSTTANLSWTLPTGSYDGIMIAVLPTATPDNPTCDGITLTAPNTDFSLASVYCGNASGAVYVYNNVGTTVSITGLTAGTSYHFKAFTYKNSSWSTGSEIIQTAEVSNVTNLTSTCGNGESMIAWVNPSAACFDEVIIAVNTSTITGTPSGTYTANSLDYTDGSNPTLSDGSKIVYNGTVSPQTVIGLTNGTTYFFKVFVRSGTDWSSGTEVSCTATTATFFDYGDLAIVGINTHYIDYDAALSDDEIQFVCFKPITTETAIDFTDNGYERLYAGKWADSEGTIRLTRTGPDVPAGTVITVRGRGPAANWSVFIGSGTPNGTLTNDDANWTITDGGTGNNVFDLNVNDQIWMMQGGDWINPSGAHNATYTGKVLYGWTAIGWEPAPGYDDTKGSTIFPSSACSVTNLTGVNNEDKVRYDSLTTATTQRDWISRFNDEQKWTGYLDSTSYQNGGTLPDVITITGTGVSTIAKWTGETSSDWDDCTNWLNLKVPSAGTDVEFVSDDCFNDIVIQPGQTVACNNLNISGTTLTHSIRIEGDATATLEVHGDVIIGGPAGVLDCDDGTTAADGTLKVYGNWNENTSGGFLPGNSTVEFNGAVTQSINTVDTQADFYNLTINNSSAGGVTLSDPVLTTGTLGLTAGILDLNGFDITISGPFTGTNGVFGGNSLSNLTVNGTGNVTYGFSFAAPQELSIFNMNRTGETSILSTNLTVGTLQIDAGTVELSAGKYYTVSTSLINTPGATGLVLKSDATGTASLIQPSSNVQATCERYLPGGQWNYIFSPLDNVVTGIFNANNLNFYWYDETSADYWDAATIYGTTGWTPESNANLSVNKGYIQYHTATNTYNLTGGNLYDPASGSKVFTLSYTDNGTGSVGSDGVTAAWEDFEGWNLIGNPFTSAFDWNQVTLSNVENVVYYYDGTASNYKYFGGGTLYNQGITVNGGSQFVPANQGFFVKATSTNNGAFTLTVPLSARTHNAQAFWKKTDNRNINNLLKLAVENSGFTDETVIRTLSDATENHDVNYDAYKLFSLDKTKPMLFSRNSDNSHFYAINTLPEFSDEKIIPLGLFAGISDNYTIRLVENTFNKTHIYLEDKDMSEIVNLKVTGEYNFWQNATDFSDRFNIRFKLNTAPFLSAQIPDQVISINEKYIYSVPDNVFADNDIGDVLTFNASLENGKPLPDWLVFDSKSMQFFGVPQNTETLNVKITATDIFGAFVSDVYKLTVTSASFISDIQENEIRVYPNPTDGKFIVEITTPETGTISVVDISGKVIIIKTMNSNRSEIDLSSYPKGVYIVDINTGTQSIKKRIILK